MSGGRLTQSSAAVRLLRQKFEEGIITGDEEPKSLWESEKIFQKHKLANFRTCYYNLKKEYLSTADDEEEDTKITPRVIGSPSGSARKKRRIDGAENSAGTLPEPNEGIGQELMSGDHSFTPLAYLSEPWTKPGTTTKMVSLVICLPSGVTNFHTRVVDEGEYVELKIDWPSPMTDVNWMFKKFLNPPQTESAPKPPSMEAYHPKVLAFQAALKKYREHASESVKSYSRFHLPFPVQPSIDKHNLAYRDNCCKLVLLDMTAFVETYDVQDDSAPFEIA